ncbi:hypothetical protein D3C73_1308200 [compost metagenome]
MNNALKFLKFIAKYKNPKTIPRIAVLPALIDATTPIANKNTNNFKLINLFLYEKKTKKINNPIDIAKPNAALSAIPSPLAPS